MNSPFANIYQALVTQLLAINLTLPGTPTLYVDMDYGQLEHHERPDVALPCALVDFKEWTYENAGGLVQLAQGTVCIKLAIDPYAETSSITPSETVQLALGILDVEYQVYQALQGWKAPTEFDNDNNPIRGTTAFVRLHLNSDDRRPGLKVRHIYFTTSFLDYSAARTYASAPATPGITTTFNT